MPRSSKQGNDTAVQGTNDSSIVSKCSTAARGYVQDDFLRLFVSKTARRAPLINRGYYIRARVIDDVLQQFLALHCDQKNQIISLGAGFDSAFFRLHANNRLANTAFYEVDFPDVVRRKATIIKDSPVLRRQLGDAVSEQAENSQGVYLASSRYHLLGVDLSNLQFLEKCLTQTGLDHHLPTLLLSECVLTYMEVKSSNALIQWASSFFPNALFVTYEQIHPHDAFGLVMQNHFHKLNSALKAIQTYPTIEAQRQRFHTLGWQGTSAISMNSYYYTRLPLKERRRIECLEPFDEFEEWHLKCSHYAVVAGCNGSLNAMLGCFGPDDEVLPVEGYNQCTPNGSIPSLLQTPSLHSNLSRPLRRFGHASCPISPDSVLVLGGFGDTGSRHARLGDVAILSLTTGTWDTLQASPGSQEIEPQMHHTLTTISGGMRFFLFGGRSSPTRPSNSAFILTLMNTQEQTKRLQKPLNQDGQTLLGETSSPGSGSQTTRAQLSNSSESPGNLESTSKGRVPDLRTEAAGRAVNRTGCELDASGCRNSSEDCRVTSSDGVDATSSCEAITNDPVGYIGRVEGWQCNKVNSTYTAEAVVHSSSADLGKRSVETPVHQGDAVLGALTASRGTDAEQLSSMMDEVGLQVSTNGAEDNSQEGLKPRTGCLHTSRHSQGCAEGNENSETTVSAEIIRGSVMCSPSDMSRTDTNICSLSLQPQLHVTIHSQGCAEGNENSETTVSAESNQGSFMSSPSDMSRTDTNICSLSRQPFSYSYRLIPLQTADAPEPRWRHSAVHVTLNANEYVVIYGGRSTEDKVYGDCWLFDVQKLNWQKLDIAGNPPPPSHSHTACVWQGTKMVIAGGLGPNLQPLSSVYIIDLKIQNCQEINLSPALPPRYSHTAHVVGNKLLLVGGVSPLNAHRYAVVIVNLETAAWYQESFPACHAGRPLMVHSHTSHQLVSDTSLVILGGGGNCFSFGTHLNNTPVQISLPL